MLRKPTDKDHAFRSKARTWLQANFPKEKAWTSFGLGYDQAWQQTMAAGGWLAPHWPREDGGMGLSPVQQLIMIEEWAKVGAPPIPTQEMNHIGPLLLLCGSDAQKREHMPKMLRAESKWAQCYSEPGSGSDLSSLRTAGAIEGDTLVVNGQKTWNTLAHGADWIYALIRTGEGRRAITFVLIDAASQGITRRRIRDLAGEAELSEVFFDDVRVPLSNVVGSINDGWRVANALLSKERSGVANPGFALNGLHRLRKAARATGADRDPWLAERIARAEVAVLQLEAAFLDALEQDAANLGSSHDASYLKVLASETIQLVLRVLQEVSGPNKALSTARDAGADHTDFSKTYLSVLPFSIFGGSDEIQRTLIAQTVLGLPRSTK
jgi:alkylation response protein AidB-like acyl-CoA dehydrogenase